MPLTQGEFDALDINGNGTTNTAELQALLDPPPIHNADQNADGHIALSELLRVVQFYNAGGYSCASNPGDTEDGFLAEPTGGGLDPNCFGHASDYGPENGILSPSELLRLVQFYNLGAIAHCPGLSEDHFCAVSS